MKIDHQNLSSNNILEFSGPTMHEVTNTRLKNLINNRKNQKEQMQNYIPQQNINNLYADEPPISPIRSQQNINNLYAEEPPVSPIRSRPRSNGSDTFAQTAQSVTSQNRTGNNLPDNGTTNDESVYNNQSLEPTYEPLRNLPPPSPDSELSWRKSNSPSNLENESIQKDLENGHQESNKGTKNFLLENNQSSESLSFSETRQNSMNGYPYRTYFESGESQELRNTGVESFSNNTTNHESYHPSTTPKSPPKYSSQNAQPMYNNHYYQNASDINSYSNNTNENPVASDNTYTPTSGQNNLSSSYSQQTSQSPVSKESLPSSYAQNQSSSFEQQQNGKMSEVSSGTTGSQSSAIDVTSRINKESSDQDHFLLNSTTSMNTYSNIINSFNVNPSNFATSSPSVTLPTIASLFSSGHTVISNASDLGSQLKVSYANPNVASSPWPSGGSHPSHIDSGRTEEFCGLDPTSLSSLGGIFSSFIATVSSPVPTTSSSDTGKMCTTNTSEASWWEQNVKLEVPPASPDCQVLENQSSSPSTTTLPTSL